MTPPADFGRDDDAMRWTASWLTTGPPNQPWLVEGPPFGGVRAGDMGREKLTECLWSDPSSETCASGLPTRCVRFGFADGPEPLSRLAPRPPPRCVGDATRWTGSRLDARRCTLPPAPGTFWGTAGTGGMAALASAPLGDGLRKERSVMDPELEWRRRPCGRWLFCDEAEPRRTMRFVTVSPTGVGLEVWERRAAAAAALERVASEAWLRTKAVEAASDADALGGGADRWGCIAGGG